MKTVFALAALVTLTACTPRINIADLAPGMTRQEVTHILGKPVSASIMDSEQQLIYLIHDHAFNRDKNYYSLGFKDGKLTNVIPLPSDMQEDSGGLVDRALRRPFMVIKK